MAITTYTDFVNNYLVKNGQIGDATNINKSTDQLKKEVGEIILLDNNKVPLTGNATISGTKTFSSTIIGNINGNATTASTLQTARTINGVSFTGGSNINVNTVASETIKFDTGTTEGTDLYTFNGSTAKTIDIKAGTNISLTKAAGSITISANDTSINWYEIQGKPNTISGYNITDALSISGKAADSDLLDGMNPTSAGQGNTIMARDSLGGTVLSSLDLVAGIGIRQNNTNYQILYSDNTQINLGNGFANVNIKGATAWHNGNTPINKNQSGSMNLPNGMILKWGLVSSSASQDTVTFPTSFPAMCSFASATLLGAGAGYASLDTSPTTAQVTFNKSQGYNLLWYAIGF